MNVKFLNIIIIIFVFFFVGGRSSAMNNNKPFRMSVVPVHEFITVNGSVPKVEYEFILNNAQGKAGAYQQMFDKEGVRQAASLIEDLHLISREKAGSMYDLSEHIYQNAVKLKHMNDVIYIVPMEIDKTECNHSSISISLLRDLLKLVKQDPSSPRLSNFDRNLLELLANNRALLMRRFDV